MPNLALILASSQCRIISKRSLCNAKYILFCLSRLSITPFPPQDFWWLAPWLQFLVSCCCTQYGFHWELFPRPKRSLWEALRVQDYFLKPALISQSCLFKAISSDHHCFTSSFQVPTQDEAAIFVIDMLMSLSIHAVHQCHPHGLSLAASAAMLALRQLKTAWPCAERRARS